MSVCVFVAADCPLPEVRPPQEYPLYINLDTKTVDDGGADDNFSLLPFAEVDIYANMEYGVCLEWAQYTEGRAKRIIEYIREALCKTDRIEMWNVWLAGYWEYDDRPVIHKTEISIGELTVEDIREICDAKNWNNKESDRPSFYCMEVRR